MDINKALSDLQQCQDKLTIAENNLAQSLEVVKMQREIINQLRFDLSMPLFDHTNDVKILN